MTLESKDKIQFCSVYALVFNSGTRDICFYVGRTNDTARRLKDHRSKVNDPLDTTLKYRFMRELERGGYEWRMEVLTDFAEDDEDTEYEWVLRIARNNRFDGISFYEDMPLTNMKRGDFLEEMLQERDLNTAKQIREWRQVRELRKAMEYEAKQFQAPQNDAFGRVMARLGGTSTVKRNARVWDLPKVEKKTKKSPKKP